VKSATKMRKTTKEVNKEVTKPPVDTILLQSVGSHNKNVVNAPIIFFLQIL
jgi:hypothetical protein